ncbi:MAG: hypothetical protein Q8829_02935, partial [Candidatus Phytoplasma australasiaticum]|nr:hypothetical protein [Candidatus Phytoplasma australasiaticum]
SHLVAIKRIFRYLKGTPKLGIWYPRDSGFDLTGYSDADYAGCRIDRKSTTGTCQFLGNKLVSWFSKNKIQFLLLQLKLNILLLAVAVHRFCG